MSREEAELAGSAVLRDGVREELRGARMTEAEFALLRDVIHRESGILLAEGKASLLVARLARRLRALGLSSFMDYYVHLMAGRDPDELQTLLDLVTTNETRFFREPDQLHRLEKQVYPVWREEADAGKRRRAIRAWSAACSTGEEAYSLAMSLLWHLPAEEGWQVEVLGTDLSRSALSKAVAGVWSVEQARHVPSPYLKRFMRRGTNRCEGFMTAGTEIRDAVRFGRANLCREEELADAPFDLILCRNVLIYFDETTRSQVLRQLGQRLGPGGLLVLGHAENPGRALSGLERFGTLMFRSGGANTVGRTHDGRGMVGGEVAELIEEQARHGDLNGGTAA